MTSIFLPTIILGGFISILDFAGGIVYLFLITLAQNCVRNEDSINICHITDLYNINLN